MGNSNTTHSQSSAVPGGTVQAAAAHLDEANILGILTEALAADIQPVLADQAPLVGAYTAAPPVQNFSHESLLADDPKNPTKITEVQSHSTKHRQKIVEQTCTVKIGDRVETQVVTIYVRPCCEYCCGNPTHPDDPLRLICCTFTTGQRYPAMHQHRPRRFFS